jgi:hypothetical protein
VEPAEGTRYHPPLGQPVEAFEPLQPLDHLEADMPPGPQGPHPGDEIARRGLLGPNQTEPSKSVPEDLQELRRAIPIWHTGSRDHDAQEQAQRVDQDVPLAPFDLLMRVEAVDPLVAVVLTD